MGGRRKKARRVRAHANKYRKYSKAEKIMEQQINEEMHKLPEQNIEEMLEDEHEEKLLNKEVDEFDIPYYKDVESYSGSVRRGEIYFFDKGPKVGVEQQGGRPGIIVSNNLCNKHSEFVEVVYTTCQPKTELPTHVPIISTPKPCTALCEQIHTLSKKKIRCYYGEITAEEECAINKALAINLSLPDTSCKEDKDIEIEQVKLLLDAALEANAGYEQEVQELTKQLEQLDIDNKHNSNSSDEDSIYKTLYNELLDKVLRLKLQEEK